MITSNIFIPIILISLTFGLLLFLKPNLVKNEKALTIIIWLFSLSVVIIVFIAVYNRHITNSLKKEISNTNATLTENYEKSDSLKNDIKQTIENADLTKVMDTITTFKIEALKDSSVHYDFVEVKAIDPLLKKESLSKESPKTFADTLLLVVDEIDNQLVKFDASIYEYEQLKKKLEGELNSSQKEYIKGKRALYYESELKKANDKLETLKQARKNLFIRKEKILATANYVVLDTTRRE